MIVRGTTPYHTFILPLKVENIDTLYITYLQNNEVILDKAYNSSGVEITDTDFETENANMENLVDNEINTDEESLSKITVHLTQEETLKFHFYPAAEKNIAVVQVRVLDTNGEAYASNPVRERIFGVLKDGVISNEH